ncbi:Macrolide export ATP-binding/permease protein MacB [Lactococcus lactis subsp. lactis bv. diacetylactis]|nr:Macrolide export ATP-binding/permease protein MacB [Lactococcus lactis subsp. lactis bv. diacetylactis]
MLTIQSQLLTELSAALTVLLFTTKMLTIQSHFTDNFSGLLLSFL